MSDESSTWGGKREGAGRKPTKNGNKKLLSVRVPESQAEHLAGTYGTYADGIRYLIELSLGMERKHRTYLEYKAAQAEITPADYLRQLIEADMDES